MQFAIYIGSLLYNPPLVGWFIRLIKEFANILGRPNSL